MKWLVKQNNREIMRCNSWHEALGKIGRIIPFYKFKFETIGYKHYRVTDDDFTFVIEYEISRSPIFDKVRKG